MEETSRAPTPPLPEPSSSSSQWTGTTKNQDCSTITPTRVAELESALRLREED